MSESSEDSPSHKLKIQRVNVMDVDKALATSVKKNLTEYLQSPNTNKKYEIKNRNKPTKVRPQDILSDNLCGSTAGQNYWETMAEKRRSALQEALEENERLWKENDILNSENSDYRKMLDEANSFVEVFSELIKIKDPVNDTGIDLGDVSQDASEVNQE